MGENWQPKSYHLGGLIWQLMYDTQIGLNTRYDTKCTGNLEQETLCQEAIFHIISVLRHQFVRCSRNWPCSSWWPRSVSFRKHSLNTRTWSWFDRFVEHFMNTSHLERRCKDLAGQTLSVKQACPCIGILFSLWRVWESFQSRCDQEISLCLSVTNFCSETTDTMFCVRHRTTLGAL